MSGVLLPYLEQKCTKNRKVKLWEERSFRSIVGISRGDILKMGERWGDYLAEIKFRCEWTGFGSVKKARTG